MATRYLRSALVAAAIGAPVLAGGCGGGGDDPPLLGLETFGDASAGSSSSPGTTSTGSGNGGGGSGASGGDGDSAACSTIDTLLGQYSLQAECSPCIDVACSTELVGCNASCTCPLAVANYVNCVSLGASSSTCGTVAAAATNAQTVLAILMCSSTCKEDCHQLDTLDGGIDAGDGAASADASAADAGDAGATDGAQ